MKKIDTCQNNPQKSYTEKKAKHKPSGYSRVIYCSFDKSKTEWSHYRGKDCMEIFCKDLRDQPMKIINYEKKKIIPLTDEEKESYEKQRIFYICKKPVQLIKRMKKNVNYTIKSEITTIIHENIEELPIVFVIYAIKYRKRFL